jgi:hypothetical protein
VQGTEQGARLVSKTDVGHDTEKCPATQPAGNAGGRLSCDMCVLQLESQPGLNLALIWIVSVPQGQSRVKRGTYVLPAIIATVAAVKCYATELLTLIR